MSRSRLAPSFERLLANSPTPTALLDHHARVQYWNPASTDRFGWRAEEVRGGPPPHIPDALLQQLRASLRRPEGRTPLQLGEVSLVDRNGTPHRALITVTPLRESGGHPSRFILAAESSEERSALDETLLAGEVLYRRLVDVFPEGMYTLASDGRFLFANQAAADIYGYPDPGTMRGISIFGHAAPEDYARGVADMERIAAEGRAGPLEYCIIRTDGSRAFIDCYGALLRVGAGSQVYLAVVHDITEHKHVEDALRSAERRYRALFQAAPIGIQLVNEQGMLTETNPAFQEMLGYAADELVGQHWTTITHPEDVEKEAALDREMDAGARTSYRLVKRYVRKDGGSIWTRLSSSDIGRIAEEDYEFSIGMVEDITEQQRAQDALRESEERYRRIVESAQEAICVVDAASTITFVNQACADMFGYGVEDMAGKSILDFMQPADKADYLTRVRSRRAGATDHLEVRGRHRSGKDVWFLISARPLTGDEGEYVGQLVMGVDVTERKRYEEQIRYQALHDPLTDLPNRTLLADRIDQAIRRADRQTRPFALLLLDLNRFKLINNTFGHPYGDRLLQTVGHRLQRLIRRSDTVARLGGDEFAVLLEAATAADAVRIAATLARTLEDPYLIDSQSLYINGSFGIAVYPDHGQDGPTLLQHADVAMYVAKEQGESAEVYDPARDRHTSDTLALIADLRRAIGGDEFMLHFQPKVDPSLSRVLGVEALARWRNPRRGWIPPGRFIELAENTGLIHPLSVWVVNTALAQCAAWQDQGMPINIAINLSARNLADRSIFEMIIRGLEQWRVDPALLTLEITETSLMLNPMNALDVVTQMHNRGMRVAIDDFGIGYSSLRYLQQLPVDEIKIDRSFVLDMETNPDSATIVSAIVDLGHKLGLHVVAEGVETQQACELLRAMGSDSIQGYFVSQPQPANAFARWAQERTA